MSYLVLARKYRPQRLEDLAGQQHIVDSLKGALEADRVAHAYLFCGPRGIGKTSCARILSMCLNCEDGPRVDPDPQSPACREIAQGSSFDVLEIDGASNRGIDDIRALRETVKFAPASGRYKIYIIDEVHQITSDGFNALLKTLEEPPSHVKFIFATTEPHKIPATILSRCQRFDFKRVEVKEIVTLLKNIAIQEKLDIDDEALYAIAKSAEGGVRDALSVLDQASAFGQRGIKGADIYSMLGLVELDLLFKVAEAIGTKDAARAFEALQDIIDRGKDVKQLYRDLVEHFRDLMVVKVGGRAMGKLLNYPNSIKDLILRQTELFSLKEIIVAIDVLVQAAETARITHSARLPLELAVAKLTWTEVNDDIRSTQSTAQVAQSSQVPSVSKASVSQDLKREVSKFQVPVSKASSAKNLGNPCDEVLKKPIGGSQKEPAKEQKLHVVTAEDIPLEKDESLTLEKILRLWDSLTFAVSRKKMSVATFLQEGQPLSVSANKITVGFHTQSQFQKESLEDSANQQLVEKAFAEKLGQTVLLKYVISDDHAPRQEEESVRKTLDTFGGEIVNRWHTTDEV